MTAQELAVCAAALSAFAAIASATAAWRVPHAVAKYADERRKESEARARKQGVLEALIQHRATISYPASVAALNSIPMVFPAESKVREAFNRFMAAANAKPFEPARLIERHLLIINAIVEDLGLDGQLTQSDLDTAYYPELLGRAHQVETEDVIRRSQAFEPTANNAPTLASQ